MLEKSYGIIPLHRQHMEWRILLVHHQKGHWGFPKGHADEGEGPHQAAKRELLEETGLQVIRFLPVPGLHERYQVEGKEKEVTYFLAEVEGHVIPQLSEIQNAEWFTLEDARARLTFPEGRDVLHKAKEVLDGTRF